MLATHHQVPHYFLPERRDYQCISFLESLGFKEFTKDTIENPILVNESDYPFCYEQRFKGLNIFLKGYFEDRRFYEPHRELIKSWFPKVNSKNKKDLVFHFRTGDRLFYRNEFNLKPQAARIKKAIESFDFEKLHIVTDMYDWKRHTPESLSLLDFHVKVPKSKSVSNKLAVEYFNSCFDVLDSFKPVVTYRNVLEDFNFIRSFDKILFQHGTMSWWASFLSNASTVGVYGPWRQWKGDSNKNLSNVEINGWFKWQ